jgi:hypothetical protein
VVGIGGGDRLLLERDFLEARLARRLAKLGLGSRVNRRIVGEDHRAAEHDRIQGRFQLRLGLGLGLLENQRDQVAGGVVALEDKRALVGFVAEHRLNGLQEASRRFHIS